MKSNFTIAVLPGDGIGPEVINQAISVIKTAEQELGLTFNLQIIPCGGKYYLEHEQEWPDGAFEKCQQADAILLGAVGYMHNNEPVMTIPGKPYTESRLAGYAPVIGNRQRLNLFANVRPIKLYKGISHRISGSFKQVWEPANVDYIIVRENTEDAYTGEFIRSSDKVVTPIMITRSATEKIVRFAFELAKKRGKQFKVTCVDKSNIVEAHQYFKQIFHEIGKAEFPEISRQHVYADAFCQMQLLQPEVFDVVVCPNLIGDIISDNGAVTQGGLGMAPGANIGEQHAMFEPIHGSALEHVGKNTANPIGTILAVQLMLVWLSEKFNNSQLYLAATCLEDAVKTTIAEKILTQDLVEKAQSYSLTKVGENINLKFKALLVNRLKS